MAIQFTTLFSFDSPVGPYAEMTSDANGNLFGATYFGGATGDGTVFEIRNIGTIDAPIYATSPTILANFDAANGSAPTGLTIDANGNVFGTTSGGGGGNGTVFEIQNIGTIVAPVYASTPTTLVNFDGSNGAGPNEGLVIADAFDNELFGTTFAGGTGSSGTLFEIGKTRLGLRNLYAVQLLRWRSQGQPPTATATCSLRIARRGTRVPT